MNFVNNDDYYFLQNSKGRAHTELFGISVMDGVSIGKAHIHHQNISNINVTGKISESEVDDAIQRFRGAVNSAFDDIDQTISMFSDTLDKDTELILFSQKELLNDPEFIPQIEELIKCEFFSPERAIFETTNKYVLMFESMQNEYWNQRSTDVRDGGNRLLKHMAGMTDCELQNLQEPVIIIADDLSAADTVQLDKSKVLAFVTQKGGITSHTAIFARMMNIPAIIGVDNLLSTLKQDEMLIVDCIRGKIIPSPSQTMIDSYKKIQSETQKRFSVYLNLAKTPAVTKDGVRIHVQANIVAPKDTVEAIAFGSDGVGMVRTEWLYMNSQTLPSEEEQFHVYKEIAENMNDHGATTLRTLDIGGDKAVRYLKLQNEENPALGLRGIRLTLQKKDIFLTQLRAILRASYYGKIRILLPMVSLVEEINETKILLEEAKQALSSDGFPYDDDIEIGVMIETPVSACLAETYCEIVDFLGVGTNDLIQHIFAVDRNNPQVSYLYDYYHPIIHKIIRHLAKVGKEKNISVSICGDIANTPAFLPLLIGLGIRYISIPVYSIPKTKYLICQYSVKKCEELAELVLSKVCKNEVKEIIDKYKSIQ